MLLSPPFSCSGSADRASFGTVVAPGAVIAPSRAENAVSRKVVATLTARTAGLERRLGLNSGKPPLQ